MFMRTSLGIDTDVPCHLLERVLDLAGSSEVGFLPKKLFDSLLDLWASWSFGVAKLGSTFVHFKKAPNDQFVHF